MSVRRLPVFAIGIWIDDKKIEGSVLPIDKMRNISDPKLAVVSSDLQEGDIVKAKCKGFSGLHRCVIGKIGYEGMCRNGALTCRKGEDKVEEFEDLIDSPIFQELVKKFGSRYRPELGQNIRNSSTLDLEENHSNTSVNNGEVMPLSSGTLTPSGSSSVVQKSPVKKNTKKPKGNKCKENHDPVHNNESPKAPAGTSHMASRSTDMDHSPPVAKKSRKNQNEKLTNCDNNKKLEAVASQLELTELASAVSTNERTKTSESQSEVHDLLTSALVRDSLEVVNSPIECQSARKTCECESRMLQEISVLRNECSSGKLQICTLQNKVQSLENTISSLWSWTSQLQQEVRYNMMQQSVQRAQQPSGSEPSVHDQSVQQLSGSVQSVDLEQPSSSLQSGHVQPSSSLQSGHVQQPESDCQGNASSQEEDCNVVIAGFTIAQLKYRIAHLTSFSKAAVLLFRTLYKEEEYIGKTLVGIGGKPAVDQEKLNVIYEIVKKQFPAVTTPQIRLKLADILKPSRNTKAK